MDTVERTGGDRSVRHEKWATRLSDVWDVGVVVLDPHTNVDFASDKARALLHVSNNGELADTWRPILDRLTPEIARAVPGNGTPIDALVTVDTGSVPTNVHVQIYVVEEEDCVGHLLLVQPAERAAAVDASLRHAAHSRSLTSLYRDMAHDLKSVLNVIGLNLALLARVGSREHPSPTELEMAGRCGDVMRRELKRLDHSIDLILDRNLLERKAPERFDLSACCDRVAQLVGARAARQRVTVQLSVPQDPVVLEGFPDRIQGAILNLAVNALDAMPEGGHLEFHVWREPTTAHVRICDTGPGIPEEVLPHIWTLHHTTKPLGTGIGLHVARAAAEAHRGRLAYQPREEGTGACFTLDFPDPIEP